MTIFYLDYENGSNTNDGSTWALAWRTITTGATAVRIAPGDIIRIAKSPAPVSIGNADWTNLSKTVTLASAQTLTIDLCENPWTANGSGDTTCNTSTINKEGTYAALFTLDSSPQTSTLQAYKTISELDLSTYQKLSFWFRNSAAVVANNWKICLCSDTEGATPVDTFLIPAISSTAQYLPLTLARVGGGNLGASIQSIAVYTNSSAPTASSNILIDDIIACTTDGLNLQSLISKNSAEQGGDEGWFGIQSINGTTVLLDNSTNCAANEGRGYSGTTETVTTYKRETIKTSMGSSSSTYVQNVQEGGTYGNNIEFQGGWNTVTTEQDGETFFDGLNGLGYGLHISSKSYVTINLLNMCRYYRGFNFNTATNCTIIRISNANNNTNYGIYLNVSSNNNVFETVSNVNNNALHGIFISNSCSNNTLTTIMNMNSNFSYNFYISGSNNIISTIGNMNNGGNYGLYLSGNNNVFTTMGNANNNANFGLYLVNSANTMRFLSTANNGNGGIYNEAINYLYNAIISETIEVTAFEYANTRLFSHNHDNTAGNHWIFTDGGTINAQVTDRHTASGLAWTMTVNSATRDLTSYPLDFKIAKIACAANALVTVKAWMKKSHATNIGARLVCRGGQLAGVSSDVYSTKANDTDWEELTITFTPTEAGVIEIEAWAYYLAATGAYVIVDDMIISQA